jgi:hypothetical protein
MRRALRDFGGKAREVEVAVVYYTVSRQWIADRSLQLSLRAPLDNALVGGHGFEPRTLSV